MAFFNEFPFTRCYDSDLAWLIRRMKEVLARMDSVEERMAALEQLVADFIASLNIEQAIKDALTIMIQEGVFDDLLNQLFAAYTATINQRLDAQDLAIQNAVTTLTQRVDALANSLSNYYTKTEVDGMLGGLSKLTFEELALLFNPATLNTNVNNRIIQKSELTTQYLTLPDGSTVPQAQLGNIHKFETNSAIIICMSYYAGGFGTSKPTTSNNYATLRTTDAFWTRCGIKQGNFPFKISWNNGSIIKEYISGQTHHAGFDAIAIPYDTGYTNVYGSALAWYFDKAANV